MNTEIKYIENLKRAKTKIDIGFALDHIYPFSHYALLSDHCTKSQMVEYKNQALKELGV